MSNTKKKAAAATGALLASLLMLTGCSGADSSGPAQGGDGGSADLSAAQTMLDEAMAEVTSFDFPTEPVEAVKDQFIVGIPCAEAAEGCKRAIDSAEKAAQKLGWKFQRIDGAGDPEKMRAAIRTAVQLGADGIFMGSLPPDVVKGEVAAARAAGIGVFGSNEPADPGLFDGNVVQDRVKQGAWTAAFLAVATEGKGKIAIINDPGFPSIVEQHQGLTDTLPTVCPGCEVVRDFDFQIANLQTQVPAEFQAIMTANPNVDAVWTAYDPVAAAILPVIDRADRSDSITVASHNGDPFALEYVKEDNTALKATVAYNMEWIGYAMVDQFLRFKADKLTEEQSVVHLPSKLITKENITSVPWDGDMDWVSAYEKLWGLQ